MLIVVAALTSACQRKAEGQTVAVVNGEEITTAELNAEFASANIPANLRKEEATQSILQRMIDRRLLTQEARSAGLDQTPDFLNQQRRTTEDLLIRMLAMRQLNTQKVPTAEELARFQASRPEAFAKREIWYLDQLNFDTPKDPRVLASIPQARSLADLEAILSKAGIAFTRGKNRINTSVIPHDFYGKIATSTGPFVVPGGNRMVASIVTSREPAPLVGEAARPVAVAMLRREQGAKVMENRLKAIRQSAKIDYKEGFKPKA